MFQCTVRFVVFVSLALICGGLVRAQDETAESKDDIASERQALIEDLSATIAKLQALDESSAQDSPKTIARQLLWLTQLQNSKRFWHVQDPDHEEYGRLVGSVSVDPRLRAGRYSDVLWRYGNVNDELTSLTKLAADAIRPSPYWIGVQCEPVESYELAIDDSHVVAVNGGMKVNAVTEGSPAKEAGVSTDDIIVFFNESPINEIGQLVLAIGENENQPAELSLVREEKMIKVNLTPTLRKQDADENKSDGPEAQHSLSYAWDLQFAPNSLPDDYEAVVRYKRGDAIELKLTKADDSWQATADTVVELPEDARGFATQLFDSTSPLVNSQMAMTEFILSQPDEAKLWPKSHSVRPWNTDGYLRWWQKDSTSKLDGIQKQLNELQDAINEMKKD